jgi:hypothetical protein
MAPVRLGSKRNLAGFTDKKLVFARPPVLSAARVKHRPAWIRVDRLLGEHGIKTVDSHW